MSGLEPHITRVLTQAGQKLFGSIKNRRERVRIRRGARPLVAPEVAERLLAELNQDQTRLLCQYLASPDFEEVVLQYLLGQLLEDVPREDLQTDIRHEILLGLRHNVDLPPACLRPLRMSFSAL